MSEATIAPPGDAPRRAAGFWLLITLVALVGAGKAIQSDSMDPDAFWHLRVAEQLRADGIGPLVDRISFASINTPWTPYSWLAELFMAAVWSAGGFRLATLVTAACSMSIVMLIAAAARARVRTRNDIAVALVTAVATFFTLPFLSFRPVTFALAVMAAIALLLVRDRRRPTRAVWAVVPLTALLTNLHLYAVVIVALLWLTAAGEWIEGSERAAKRLVLAVAVSLAACATPMLRGALATAMNYNAVDPMVASAFITEMRPFYSGATGKASLILFVLLMGVCVWRRRLLTPTDWLWLALGVVLLFRLGRFSPVFAMLAMPAVARAFPPLRGRALERRVVRVALIVVLVAGVGNMVPAFGERDINRWLNRHHPTYPTAAAAYVTHNVRPTHGRLINEFNWGGYLAWRLGDRYQVLMDGRTQLFSPAFWQRTHLGDRASRTALLQTITADAAVLPAADSALMPSLLDLGWREVYRDELAVVLMP